MVNKPVESSVFLRDGKIGLAMNSQIIKLDVFDTDDGINYKYLKKF